VLVRELSMRGRRLKHTMLTVTYCVATTVEVDKVGYTSL